MHSQCSTIQTANSTAATKYSLCPGVIADNRVKGRGLVLILHTSVCQKNWRLWENCTLQLNQGKKDFSDALMITKTES